MTDTNTLTPTDADIIALADKTRTGEPGRDGYILPISFARAVLAKWGSPAPASQPVAATAGMQPVARIRYERNTPGRENEMPRVLSCNRMADGVYEVFTASQVQAMLAAGLAPGWRAVPVEPTKEMKVAAVKFANGDDVYKNVGAGVLQIEEEIYGEAYEAMLAAVPSEPAQPAANAGPEDAAARFKAQHEFLIWSREQTPPPIESATEYSVFNQAVDFYIAARAAQGGAA